MLGLDPVKEYAYTVKMRDAAGNVGSASAPAKAQWEGGKAFKSADGKTIAIEAEHYTRKAPGAASNGSFSRTGLVVQGRA